jgi:hypothetical protein
MRDQCAQFNAAMSAWLEDDMSRPDDVHPDYTIGPISADEARTFIKKYEYLQTVGRSWYRVGARNAAGELASVACFGRPRPMADNEIVLERGGSPIWAAPNAASWFIGRAVTLAAQAKGWQIFYGFADPAAGEVGGVYRACSWMYLGQGSPGRTIGGKPRDRELFRQGDGHPWISERRYRQMGYRLADADLLGWERKFVPAKHVFAHIEVWGRDDRDRLRRDKKAERALRAAFNPLPYPSI